MQARYFDGQSAAGETVEVETVEQGLRIVRTDGSLTEWPRGSFRQRGQHLERPGEYLVTSGEIPKPGLHTRNLLLAVALVFALVAIVAGFYLGQDLLFGGLAQLVPHGAEEKLGEAAQLVLAPEDQRVRDAEVAAGMASLAERLRVAAGSLYTFHIVVSKSGEVNAWAVPGGSVGVNCGLVRQMQSADELAAVLAHEFTHVIERHATKNLLRVFTMKLGLSLIGGGDLDGLLDAAGVLGALHFMRGDEGKADEGALVLLARAGIDPRSVGRAFTRLENAGADLPGALRYLSSHPPTAERRELAEAAAARALGSFTPALPADQFAAMQRACR